MVQLNVKCFFIFIVYCLLLIKCDARDTFTVGALFHEDSEETEFLFRNAINRYNMFNHNIHFKTIIHYVSKTNPFDVSKNVCEIIKNDGMVAIFGPSSPDVAPMVQSITRSFNIPNMQVHWSPQNSQSSINLYPDANVLSTALATIVTNLNWNSYIILYENKNSLVKLQDILKLGVIGNEPISVKQLSLESDYRVALKEVQLLNKNRFIIDCSSEHILEILTLAKTMKLLDYTHAYFLTSLDAHTLDYSKLETKANITTIRMIDPDDKHLFSATQVWEHGETNYNKELSLSPNDIKVESALTHDAVNLFTSSFQDLHLNERIIPTQLNCDSNTSWDDGFKIINYMQVRPLPDSLTGNIKFEQHKRTSLSLQVIEILQGKFKKISTWNSENPDELNFVSSHSDEQQRVSSMLSNETLVVSSRIGHPYLMWREPSFPGEVFEGNEKFEGYSLDLIDSIAKMLNFKYEFVLAADKKYGNYDKKTKSWNGLVKDILDRRADLAICDLTITHQRRSVVDFSLPFMTLGISILYSKPKPVERNIFAFMDPLDPIVWIYIVTAYVTFSLIIYLITRMAPGDWENPHPCDDNPEELENIWDLKNCFWLTLGSTMSQGCDILPKGISSRMGISMWWFFILIISSSYTANLAAFLTMVRMGPSIDNAEALSKQTKIKYGTVDGGATQAFFKESNFTTYQRMWMQMSQAKPSVFEKSNADGVKRVKTTKNQLYAFLMESSSIEYEIERDCELRQVGSRLDSKGYGIAMPVNSIYRKQINNAVLKMQEDGTLSRLKVKWWKKMRGGGACDEKDEEPSDSSAELALANVGGVFVVLGVGVGIAFVISLAEFLSNVYSISVEEHESFGKVLTSELLFSTKFWITKKSIKTTSSKSGSTSSNNNSNSDSQKIITENFISSKDD